MSEIKIERVKKTIERDSQEISVYKNVDEDTYWISTNIPKLARKYQDRLVSGRKVYNEVSGELVELHGLTDATSPALTAPREFTDEQRQTMSERLQKAREATNDERN